MSLFSRVILALLKPILLGVVVAGMLLIFFPEFRKGEGLNLHWLNQESQAPARLSYYDALAQSAPAVANIYSVSFENTNSLFRNRQRERTSLGSGVVMNSDGYILTCFHVIRDADSIWVAIQDRPAAVQAQLIGFDVVTDLAVLRINEDNLHIIPQVEDPDLRVGDMVMAIGNPLDLGQTVTAGIVSRVGKNGLANYVDFVQTDAVLNPGNSGGALIDSNGTLVGITNANFKTLDNRRRPLDVNGVNFAVPYTLAKRVMDEIIESGTVIRGELGFAGNFYDGHGIVVREVSINGPADLAGLRESDILVSVGGQKVTGISQTLDFIAETRPGTQLDLVVSRNEQLITLTVTVGELDTQLFARRS